MSESRGENSRGNNPARRPRQDRAIGEQNRPAGQRERSGVQRDRFTNVDDARRVTFAVLRAVDADDAYANLALPKMLRAKRLNGRDAAFATELTYGVLRGRGAYDALIDSVTDRDLSAIDAPVLDVLRMGVHQLLAMRVPDHAAVATSVALARVEIGAGPSGLVNAVLRSLVGLDLHEELQRLADAAGGTEDARLALVHSHPEWIVRSMREALRAHGSDVAELPALLAADNEPPVVAICALPGLAEPGRLLDPDTRVELEPGRWSPTAALVRHGDPGAVPAVRDGLARVQDEGSQLVAHLLAAAPVEGRDEAWLDLCAGPGGKAALLAAVAATRDARLTAVEVAPHRATLVRNSLAGVRRTYGEASVDVRVGDGRELGAEEPASYDRVLVDAPCTGLGALRRRPEARWRRTPADLGTLGPLQRSLLASAIDAVRPGGVVAYATCSPVLAETRLVVDDAVKAAAKRGITVERLDTPALLKTVPGAEDMPGTAAGQAVQLWPHTHGTDAMHVQLLRRT